MNLQDSSSTTQDSDQERLFASAGLTESLSDSRAQKGKGENERQKNKTNDHVTEGYNMRRATGAQNHLCCQRRKGERREKKGRGRGGREASRINEQNKAHLEKKAELAKTVSSRVLSTGVSLM